MKHLKKIPFFCLLAISCILFTVCAILGRKEAYRNYTANFHIETTPLLSLVLEGIYDHVMPWECLNEPKLPDYLKSPHSPDTQADPADIENSINTDIVDSSDSLYDKTNSSGIVSDSSASQTSDASSTFSSPAESGTSADNSDVDNTQLLDSDNSIPVPLGPDGLPIVNYQRVEEDYFDDAVFIGDSRTRSLQLYAGFDNTTFLADTGLTIYTVLDKKLTPSTQSAKTTVRDYLTSHQFKKIYLMLGINELGTGDAESFGVTYLEVLNTLRELQPDAIIYLQAILHVSEEKENEHTYINNTAIMERNEVLKTFADNTHIFWLDANSTLCDDNGFLLASYTFDGVHLKAKYIPAWTEWLKSHAIIQNVLSE